MWNDSYSIFESIISIINVASLMIIVLFLEKNLRMNWILKEELNLFSILLFFSLSGLLLKEVFFLVVVLSSYFVGANKSYEMMSNTAPWLIVNSIFSVTLLGTAFILAFKDTRIFLTNKGGKFIFRIKNKGGDN